MTNFSRMAILCLPLGLMVSCKQIKSSLQKLGGEETTEVVSAGAVDGLPVVRDFSTVTPAMVGPLIAKKDRVVVLEFFSETCPPCRALSSVFGKLASEGQPGVQYAKVSVQKYPQFGAEYGVRGIPDTRIFHNGKQIGSFVGSRSAGEVKRLVAQSLSKVRLEGEALPDQVVEPSIRPEPAEGSLPPGITPSITALPAS